MKSQLVILAIVLLITGELIAAVSYVAGQKSVSEQGTTTKDRDILNAENILRIVNQDRVVPLVQDESLKTQAKKNAETMALTGNLLRSSESYNFIYTKITGNYYSADSFVSDESLKTLLSGARSVGVWVVYTIASTSSFPVPFISIVVKK